MPSSRKIPATSSPDSAYIFGVRVDNMDVDDLHAAIRRTISKAQKALLLNVNAHALNLAYETLWLKDFFNRAEVVFADGYGAVWAGRVLGYEMKPRVTYADWFWKLASFAASESYTMYFLGANPGVADEARQVLQAEYPSLRVAGSQHGYFDHDPDSDENIAIVKDISRRRPNILVVGFGMPRQEKWLRDNWHRLEANVALTGGAVFDYVSGELPRPPRLLTEHGLEWLGRLLIEPRRLWRRYLIGNPKFVWRVLRQRLAANHEGAKGTKDESKKH